MAGVSFYNLPAVSILPSWSYVVTDYPTDAVGAFSLKKVRQNYTGNAIRVRRSSDNAEQDIGFVAENLDTAALATFCTGTDGFVATIYNQAAFANWAGNTYPDAIMSTAAVQPQIVSGGTIITDPINTFPALQFNGSTSKIITNTYDGTFASRFETFSIINITGTAQFVTLSDDGNGVGYLYVGQNGSTSTTISSIGLNVAKINKNIPAFVTRNDVYDNMPKNTPFIIYCYNTRQRAAMPNGYPSFLWQGYWQESIIYEAQTTQPTIGNTTNIENIIYSNYNIT